MGWGAGEGARERALSPSSAADHLGNSHFKPDLQCPRPSLRAGSLIPRPREKPAGRPRKVLESFRQLRRV